VAFSADQQAMALCKKCYIITLFWDYLSLFLEEMKEGIQSFDENVVLLGFDLEVIYIHIYT